jgi:hemolysin activation/secretion protein
MKSLLSLMLAAAGDAGAEEATPGARTAVVPVAAVAAPARAHDRLRIDGLTVLDAQALGREFAPAVRAGMSEAERQAVVRSVQARVRAAGRPFARAVIAPPTPEDLPGVPMLRIQVVEGRYGRVDLRGDAAAAAAPWFEDLRTSRPIGDELERQVQAVSRLPGVSIAAGLSPGGEVGEGDVDLVVEQSRRWALDLRVDNHGNRYAGRERGSMSGHVNGLLVWGDRLTASVGANSGRGWDGAGTYQVPLGTRGTRVSVTASRHHYELGGEFARLGAQGQVDTVGATAVVPLTAKGAGRLSWQIGVEGRRMVSEHRAVALSDPRRAVAVTTGLQAVAHPSAGSVAWGGVAVEVGDLRLRDAATAALDEAGARAAGEYLVLSADATLLRQWSAWGLLLRGSGQFADRNLDASKKFSLGGARNVRAWPSGETAGDHGVLAQMELRYRWQSLEPFAFLDAGRVRFSHTPWDTGARARTWPQGRTLAGAGLGLRWQHGPWRADGTAGWRLGTARQRASISDSKARVPQLWLGVSYAL